MIFNLESGVDITIDTDITKDLNQIFITGSTIKPTYLTIKGKTKLIGIRFNIGGSYPFFKDNLNNHIGQVIGFEDLEWQYIWRDLKKIDNVKNMVNILDDFLLKTIIENKIRSTDFILIAVKLLLQNSISKDELSAKLGISKRQIERKFKEVVGLSVKQINSIVRIHKSRENIRNNDFKTLTQVGYDCN